MLQLIQALMSFRHKALALWTMTVAEWDFPSCSESSHWTVSRESHSLRRLVLAAHGVMMEGGFADLLRVTLEKGTSLPAPSGGRPEEAKLFYTFAREEIVRYASQVSDPCPAHQAGEAVPPLLLLKMLFQQHSIHSGQIRFLAPVLPGQTLYLQRSAGGGLEGFTDQGKVFQVSVN